MRYDEQDRESKNVEDRRGQGGGGMFGGSGIQIPMGGGGRGGFSLTTMLIIGAVMLLFGFNPLDLLRGGGGGVPDMSNVPRMPGSQPGSQPTSQKSPFEIPGLPSGQPRKSADTDEMKKFISRVLADTEDVWSRVFQGFGQKYQDPKLVIFDRATPTACGTGQTAMGPLKIPDGSSLLLRGGGGADASWNERLAAIILVAGIVAIGVAPFWLNDLIKPGIEIIMSKIGGK